eukprot:s349_g23.t1
MRNRLERYAEEFRSRGIEGPNSITALSSASRLRCALPNGMLGSTLLQKAVREDLGSLRLRPLHWSLFNPVEATDAERMHRVLQGQEALPGYALAVHFFRKVRDEWSALGLPTPKLTPVLKLSEPVNRPAEGTHLQRSANSELAGGWLQKRLIRPDSRAILCDPPNTEELRAAPRKKRSFLEMLERSRKDFWNTPAAKDSRSGSAEATRTKSVSARPREDASQVGQRDPGIGICRPHMAYGTDLQAACRHTGADAAQVRAPFSRGDVSGTGAMGEPPTCCPRSDSPYAAPGHARAGGSWRRYEAILRHVGVQLRIARRTSSCRRSSCRI